MEWKAVSGIMLTLLLIGTLTVALNSQLVRSEKNISASDAPKPEGETVRFVMFGCLHVDETTEAELNNARDYINKLNPDYVLSVGDYVDQENLPEDKRRTSDRFYNQYVDFLNGLNVSCSRVFHVIGGTHDGWCERCGYHNGYFRILGEISDTYLVKIGNLAFIFLGAVHSPLYVPEPFEYAKLQIEWMEQKLEELYGSYNIFIVIHRPLYNTTAYSGPNDDGVWCSCGGHMNQLLSEEVKSIVDVYGGSVVMLITAHVHIDATDYDSAGRGAFMNWSAVYGNPNFLGIKTHAVCVAGISTTMHAPKYKSYQNVWYMDIPIGNSTLNLHAANINEDKIVANYTISLPHPFSYGKPLYEQQWSPCWIDYPNVKYAQWRNDSHKIIVEPANGTSFKCKFRYNTPVRVTDIAVQASGNGTITKEIAYSDDGYSYSRWYPAYQSSALGSHEHWKVGINITATSQVNISDVSLTVAREPVGGIYVPVNKLELLAPYIGLTTLLAVASTTVVYVKKRERNTERARTPIVC